MTATERLRELLDEHGVEYVLDEEYGEKYPPENRVMWSCDLAGEDMTVTARDYCININDDGSADYCLDLEFHEVFTPEQAIAATLGVGTCCDIAIEGEWFECSECGTVKQLIHPNYCPNCGRRVVE